MVALTFEGSIRRGPFDENGSRQLKRLIPHVRRALEIRDRLEAHEVRAATLSLVAEQSRMGVIVLDQKGRIVEATGLAESLLTAGNGIRRASDRTLWLKEPAGSQLREWVLTGLAPKGVILTTRIKSQMSALHIPHQQAFALQVPADPFADPLHQRLQFRPRRCAHRSGRR
jgi:PAS domain-containing protein